MLDETANGPWTSRRAGGGTPAPRTPRSAPASPRSPRRTTGGSAGSSTTPRRSLTHRCWYAGSAGSAPVVWIPLRSPPRGLTGTRIRQHDPAAGRVEESRDGGAEGTRTPDPLIANEMRYQLRHSPMRRLTDLDQHGDAKRKASTGGSRRVPNRPEARVAAVRSRRPRRPSRPCGRHGVGPGRRPRPRGPGRSRPRSGRRSRRPSSRGRWCGRVRRAGGFETYVGSVTGTGSHRLGSRSVASATAMRRPAGADSSTALGRVVGLDEDGRAPGALLLDHQPAGDQPGDQQPGRDRDVRPGEPAGRRRRRPRAPARARSRASTRRRRLVARGWRRDARRTARRASCARRGLGGDHRAPRLAQA